MDGVRLLMSQFITNCKCRCILCCLYNHKVERLFFDVLAFFLPNRQHYTQETLLMISFVLMRYRLVTNKLLDSIVPRAKRGSPFPVNRIVNLSLSTTHKHKHKHNLSSDDRTPHPLTQSNDL